MAQVDNSVYFKQRIADPFSGLVEGYKIGDLIRQRNIDDQVSEAYKAGIQQKPDGTISYDRNATLSKLAGIDGRKYLEAKSQFDMMDQNQIKLQREKQINDFDLIGRAAGSVNDQQTYDMALGDLSKRGIDVTQMPKTYDPGIVRRYQIQALSAKEQLENQLKQQDFFLRERELQDKSLDRREARDERKFQSGLKMDERSQSLQTPYGYAGTIDDAKQIKDAHIAKKTFDNKLNQLIALREKHGGGAILNREDVARGKQLSKDLLLEYKNIAKLGVLSKSDEDIINAIIPEDPLEFNSPLASLRGEDPTLSRLKAFKSDNDKSFQEGLETRLRDGAPQKVKAQSGQSKISPKEMEQAFQWAKKNPDDPRAKEIMKRIGG